MKKFLLVLMFTVISLSLIGISTLFNGNDTVFAEEQSLNAEILTPNGYFMNLNAPRYVSVNNNTVAISNETEIYFDIDGLYKYVTIPENMEKITSIGLIDDYLIVTAEKKDTEDFSILFLSLHDFTFKQIIVDEIISNTATQVFTSLNRIYILTSGNEIYLGEIETNNLNLKNSGITTNIIRNSTLKINDSKIYQYKDSKIKDITINNDTIILTVNNIKDFYVNNNFTYTILNGKIIKTDNVTNTTISEYLCENATNLTFDDNKVYAQAGEKVIVLDSDLNFINYYGSKGDSKDRLNTPKDVVVYEDSIFIADYENQRIVINDLSKNIFSELKLNFKPSKITVNKDTIFVYNQNESKIYCYNKLNNQLKREINNIGNIQAMLYHSNSLLLLESSGKVKQVNLIDNTNQYLLDNAVIIDIAINADSQNLYMLANNSIIYKQNLSTQDRLTINIETSDIMQINVDYNGSIYLNNSDLLIKYSYNSDAVYTKNYAKNINGISENFISSLRLNNGDLIFIDSSKHTSNIIQQKYIDTVPNTNTGYEHPKVFDVLQVGKILNNTIAMASPDNYEAVRNIEKNSLFLVVAKNTYLDKVFYYGRFENGEKYEYIESTDIELLAPYIYDLPIQKTPLLRSGAVIYKYPFSYSEQLTIAPFDSEIVVLSKVCGNENTFLWDWYKVSYTDSSGTSYIGFCLKDSITDYTSLTPPPKKVYYTVKADKIGVNIKLYSSPDINSAILYDDLKDGTKIILAQDKFNKSEEFTKIYYKDQVGYVLTKNLQVSGITTNQIIAISVTSVCIIILILLILILLRANKIKKSHYDEN